MLNACAAQMKKARDGFFIYFNMIILSALASTESREQGPFLISSKFSALRAGAWAWGVQSTGFALCLWSRQGVVTRNRHSY